MSAFDQVPIYVYTSGKNGDGTFGTLQSVLDNYATLRFETGFYKPGSFELTINLLLPHANALKHGRLIRVGDDNTKIGIIQTVKTELTEQGAYILTVSGQELWSILGYRQIIPPGGSANYTAAGTTPIETGIKSMVNFVCGSGAATKEKFSALTVAASAGAGLPMEISERYTNLLDACTRYMTSAQAGIRNTFTGTGWTLDVIFGTDRTSTVIFSSSLDTIQSANYTKTDTGYRNVAIVGGQGDGVARMVNTVWLVTEPSDIDRMEMFVDARDLSLSASLDNRGAQKLLENRFTSFIDVDGLTYSRYRLGVNYFVGDVVTIREFGITQSSRIVNAAEEWKNGSYDIRLTFDKEVNTITNQVSTIANTTSRQNSIF